MVMVLVSRKGFRGIVIFRFCGEIRFGLTRGCVLLLSFVCFELVLYISGLGVHICGSLVVPSLCKNHC